LTQEAPDIVRQIPDHLAFLPHQLLFHKGDEKQKNAQDKQDKRQPHGNGNPQGYGPENPISG